ncbi:hypothetical protein QIS99_05355 [Streptomyces sp. B-S-A8]|uniref:Lipoprotein n=1 Tax=Streptomyces solicavernae TaxID=3043614 RepID=A0ABT6RPM0_9ACTN|nr:hypothetical protein [Streptomyces sp. B-S-A8]MDI3385646.1 hypothetical protein [Streptomyces sp. B-S-A8]
MRRSRKAKSGTFGTVGVTLCAAALCAAGLTGAAVAGDDNGIADKSPQEIGAAAREALLGVTSLHVEAEIDGMAEPAPASFELSYDTKDNCTGTVDDQNNKGSMEVIRIGDRVWIKPDAKWLSAQAPQLGGDAAAQLLKGKYLETSVRDADGAKIAQLCDLNSFKQQITEQSGKSQGATVEKGGRTEVDGRPAITLNVTNDQQRGRMYVSTEGEPYPLKVEADDPAKGVEIDMTFSEFDRPVTVKAPPADQTVNIG